MDHTVDSLLLNIYEEAEAAKFRIFHNMDTPKQLVKRMSNIIQFAEEARALNEQLQRNAR